MSYGQFTAQDNRVFTLRKPTLTDADAYVALKNRLVEEKADIDLTKKTNRERETSWLLGQIKRMEENRTHFIVAAYEGAVVGHSFVNPRRGKSSHLAELGIMIDLDFRDIGLGTEMLKRLESIATKNGIESIILEVFESNKRACHVYTNVGYKQVGVYKNAIKHENKYIDSVMMQKILTERANT